LIKNVNGEGNEFSNLAIKNVISQIHQNFVLNLYDYRSRLLHNNRDRHIFNPTIQLNNFKFDLIASEMSLKKQYFGSIRMEYPDGQITLTFLSSWLIKRSFVEVEKILDALREEILKISDFHNNLIKPKSNSGSMFALLDSETNFAIPISDELWKEYKQMK
jgi:hypothetical protein